MATVRLWQLDDERRRPVRLGIQGVGAQGAFGGELVLGPILGAKNWCIGVGVGAIGYTQSE